MKKIKSTILGILLIASILTVINPVSAYSIQGAIDAAPVGGTVIVPAGTYTENIVINKSLTLIGENKETTKIRGLAGTTNTVSIKASNVTLKNLTIYNDQRPSDPNPLSAILLVEIGYQSYEVKNIILENNIIGPQMASDGSSGGGMAIAMSGTHGSALGAYVRNITIRNNEIKDIKGNGCGIFMWGREHPAYPNSEGYPNTPGFAPSGAYDGLVENVLIENNYIHNIRRTGIESAGEVKDITIRNNTIKNCGNMFPGDDSPKYGNGIAFFKNGSYEVGPPGADSERRNILISNNDIQDISKIGIYLFGSSHDVTIEYNRITKVTKYGIMLDSLAGPDTPDPSVPLPNPKYKQKDDAFSNIRIIRNTLAGNGKNIEIRTTYTPVIVNANLEGSMERIFRVLGLGPSKPTGEIIEED